MSDNTRYRVAVAPGDLRVVQELLNTAAKNGGRTPDLLDAPAPAAQWLSAYGIAGDSPGVSALRTLRDTLRRSLLERDHGVGDTGPAAQDVPAAAPLLLAPDGTVRLDDRPDGIAALAGRVLLAVRDAQLTGAWRRIKLCRNPDCRVAFWDSSRNTSGAWHDVRTCGNVANLRNSRARRAQPAPGR
ncbi:CGNR zinc finger domain-containing protein [Actinoplanes sp. RD1]|uniref:CGNR zinc finger domain-containing protein n=1 Tax=Actinoplanes sp. RD1 TaxID=3064538 RepID=UPI002740BA7B|nr:CGNR zinc finger domain-containing protein [Actinoplanes sp. RD1]